MTNDEQRVDVLSVSHLKVAYGGNLAVNVDSLTVKKGEIVGVVGANGAGKSSLVNGLAGWSRGHARVTGQVRLGDLSVDILPTYERVRSGLLLVPEGKLVFSHLTVHDNLTTAFDPPSKEGRRIYSRDEVYELFPRLKERRDHLGSQLSGGERQMLDEPSIGLAPMLVSQVLHTMRTLAQAGLSVLLIEQNVKAALEVVDRLVLLERGTIILQGSASEMANNPRIAQAYLGAHA
jgi:branched-chain amino acid transport system ATP-binding protein